MRRTDLTEAKKKIEMLTNHLLDSIDVDLLSDNQKIAYLKAIQPYVMPKLQDIKQETDIGFSENLQWIFEADEQEVDKLLEGKLKRIG